MDTSYNVSEYLENHVPVPKETLSGRSTEDLTADLEQEEQEEKGFFYGNGVFAATQPSTLIFRKIQEGSDILLGALSVRGRHAHYVAEHGKLQLSQRRPAIVK